MSKIICEVCGTSYSENATQCPICGSARPVDVEAMPEESAYTGAAVPYQHVKGGRFSKANVRRRNNEKQITTEPGKEKKKEKKSGKKNSGLIFIVVILLLAILAVGTYLVFTYFLPRFEKDNGISETLQKTEPSVTEAQENHCEQISLDKQALTFEGTGASHTLVVTLTPTDTEDPIMFASADDAVATVNSDGVITAVNYGETVITVSCGGISTVCKVTVVEPAIEFSLDVDDITFTSVEEERQLYTGTVSQMEITWASDDESVAVVTNGLVIAKGPGVTTIYAEYSGRIVSCIVRCDFEIPTEAEVTDPTEETQDASKYTEPFRLKNLFSPYNTDVNISTGESFTLVLVDAYGDRISGVTWSVEDSECCTVDNGTVTGVSRGQTKVIATFNGVQYTCLVRVM